MKMSSKEMSTYIKNIHALTQTVVQGVELGGQVLCYLDRKKQGAVNPVNPVNSLSPNSENSKFSISGKVLLPVS